MSGGAKEPRTITQVLYLKVHFLGTYPVLKSSLQTIPLLNHQCLFNLETLHKLHLIPVKESIHCRKGEEKKGKILKKMHNVSN